VPYITWFFPHNVKRKLILKKILQVGPGKLICFVTKKRPYDMMYRNTELSSEHRATFSVSRNKVRGYKIHLELNPVREVKGKRWSSIKT